MEKVPSGDYSLKLRYCDIILFSCFGQEHVQKRHRTLPICCSVKPKRGFRVSVINSILMAVILFALVGMIFTMWTTSKRSRELFNQLSGDLFRDIRILNEHTRVQWESLYREKFFTTLLVTAVIFLIGIDKISWRGG